MPSILSKVLNREGGSPSTVTASPRATHSLTLERLNSEVRFLDPHFIQFSFLEEMGLNDLLGCSLLRRTRTSGACQKVRLRTADLLLS